MTSQLSPARMRLLVVSLFVVSFLGALDHTVVSTSLGAIAGELGAVEQLSWVFVAYTLTSTVLIPVVGRLADLFGTKRVFLAALTVFVVGSVLCGFTQDLAQIILARVLQGAGAAGVQLSSQVIIAQVTRPRERPKYLSIIGSAFPVAILVGPLAGGLVTDLLGWRWVFWVQVPIGVLAFALAAWAVPPLARHVTRGFDVAGAATLGIGIVGLVLVASWGPGELGWTAPATLTAAAVGLLGFVAFAIVERNASTPIVPLDLFRSRMVVGGIALSTVIGVGLFSVVAYVPTYIQMVHRTTATVSGVVPIATVLGMLLSSLLAGFVVSRTGRYKPFAIAGTALAAVGLAGMAAMPIGVPLWVPVVLMGLVGIGTGAFMQLVIAIVQGDVTRERISAVTAATNLVRQIGSTTATAIVGAVIGAGVVAGLPAGLDPQTLTPARVAGLSDDLQTAVATTYAQVAQPVFAALAIVYALGVVVAILLPGGRLPDRQPEGIQLEGIQA